MVVAARKVVGTGKILQKQYRQRDFLQATLTKANSEGRSAPFDIVIVSTVALLTVADVMGRKWISPLAIAVLAATAVAGFLAGSVTAAAIV